MDMKILNPQEIANMTVEIGITKSKKTISQTTILAILAGVYIGLGSHAYLVVTQTLGERVDAGLAAFLGAAVFPVGLMLVLIAGGELFTGNNLMSLAVLNKKVSFRGLMKNWTLVFIGNFIGGLLLAFVIYKAGIYKEGSEMALHAIAVANKKMHLTFSQALIRGILCNIIVSLAVWMSYSTKDASGKIFAIWFPVMMFIVCGFEHSVANMFFLSIGKFIGAGYTWIDTFVLNFIPVTLGNIIGGGIIIPCAYYFAYQKK